MILNKLLSCSNCLVSVVALEVFEDFAFFINKLSILFGLLPYAFDAADVGLEHGVYVDELVEFEFVKVLDKPFLFSVVSHAVQIEDEHVWWVTNVIFV